MKIHIGSRKIVESNNILKLKSDINYTIVYFFDGTTILVSTTMGIIESRLPSDSFLRINRQEVINKLSISKYKIDKKIDTILLFDNQEVQVSRRRRLELRQIFKK